MLTLDGKRKFCPLSPTKSLSPPASPAIGALFFRAGTEPITHRIWSHSPHPILSYPSIPSLLSVSTNKNASRDEKPN